MQSGGTCSSTHVLACLFWSEANASHDATAVVYMTCDRHQLWNPLFQIDDIFRPTATQMQRLQCCRLYRKQGATRRAKSTPQKFSEDGN